MSCTPHKVAPVGRARRTTTTGRGFMAMAILLICTTPAMAGDLRVTELKCEYLVNPRGIDVTRPRLCWTIESPGRGRRQTAYQVLVAGDGDLLKRNQGDLWDSGKVVSHRSIQVVYAGKPLPSGRRCWWKVRAWDRRGEPSAFSRPATWTMGLLQASDWQAKWIGLDESPGEADFQDLKKAQWIWFPEGKPQQAAPPGRRYFRRSLTVPQGTTIVKARCFMAADNQFELSVNGKMVGTGHSFQHAGVYELHEHLRPGRNVLAVAVVNTGGQPNPAGLIGALRVELAEQRPLIVRTDSTWRTSPQDPTGWKTAQFDDSNWKTAQYIGPYGMAPWGQVTVSDEQRRLPARMLRREFSLKQKVRRATVYICGLGYYELHVGGRKVGDHVLDPALSEYPKRVFYVTYDVTDKLQPGDNAIGVMLGGGRYFAPRTNVPTPTRTFGYPKLLLQMDIQYDDGTTGQIVSDASWRLTTDGPIRANNDYDGELYDARMEQTGWSQAGFDDSAWQPCRLVDAPGGKPAAQLIQPMRITQTIRPVALGSPRPGVHVFDMGQNMVGFCRLAVSGPRAAKVTLRHAEVLRDDGTLYLDNIRSAKVTDTYVLRGGGAETYQPRFTYHGFRYVELRGYPGKPDLSTIQGRVVHTDVPTAGTFACSNELLNRLYRNIVWGVRGNYLSIPTDCPQRDERQGWLGDPAGRSKGESYFFDVAQFYRKWLDDIKDTQKPDGQLPDVAPAYWPFYTANVTWPSAYLIIPDWYYDQYADRRLLAEHYHGMVRWVELMDTLAQDGLMPAGADRYGDWCVPPESPELIHSKDPGRKTRGDLLATAYHCHNLRLLARYATILEKPDHARQFHQRADRVRDAFNRRFFDPETNLYDNGTQTSSVLPLSFGMVPKGRRPAVLENLVENITVKTDGHIGTGLIGGQWLMRVLSENGRPDVGYRLAANETYPSWGYMVRNDATTIWELWNGNTADPAMNSHNHCMLVGHLVVWLYEGLAGIRSDPARPGFKHVVMRPQPVGDLKFVRATHKSIHGTIASHWQINGGRFHWAITIPANTTATVYVPTTDPTAVREGNTPAAESDGVKPLRTEPAAAVYNVTSGTYNFTAPYTPR